jgi:hypothetical protein
VLGELFFFFRGEEDEREAIDGVLVFSSGGLAVIFEGFVLGLLEALAGLTGESQEVLCLGVSLFGEWCGELDSFGVAAFLVGVHRCLGRAFHLGGQGGGVVGWKRNCCLNGAGEC